MREELIKAALYSGKAYEGDWNGVEEDFAQWVIHGLGVKDSFVVNSEETDSGIHYFLRLSKYE